MGSLVRFSLEGRWLVRDVDSAAGFGERAVESIHRMVGLDDAFTVVHGDGFSWWQGEVPVRFRWRAPLVGAGVPVWRLSAEVEVVRGVDPDSAQVEAFLLLMGGMFNQFVTVVEDGVVKFGATARSGQ